jgi:ABC-2 type transport system permease protein
MNLRTVTAIAKKDFLDALRNARLLVIVLMPIGFSVLYSYLFRDTPSTMEIVFHSPEPSTLETALSGLDSVTLFNVKSLEELEDTLEAEKAAIGVVLPSGFDQALQDGAMPNVELIYPESPEDAVGVERIILQLIEGISGRPPVVDVARRPLRPASVEADEGDQSLLNVFSGLDLQSYFIILWVMMGIAMNGSFLVPTLLVEEKDRKTLDAVLVTPAGYADVAIGKVLVGMLYSLLTALIVMSLNNGFVGAVVFSVAVIVLASLALTLIGLLIGGLIDNMSTLNTWGGFIMLPLILPGMLAGIPLDNLSPVLSMPLQIIPTFQMARGFAFALSGDGAKVWLSLLILAVECLVLFAAVLWSMRRRER